MNSRSHQSLQKVFLTSVILCLIFPLVSLVLHTQGFQPNKDMEEDQSEKLYMSPTTGLSHDEWTETHGYANDDIDWSFSTSPSQVINVWVLDSSSYSQFYLTGLATGYHLTTSASGSGSFDVSSFMGQTWYVIFWNDFSGSQSTTVTYNVVFNGEPPPSNKRIFITKPDSTTEIILGSQFTIEWHTSADIYTFADLEISIYKGQDELALISSGTNNDGSYSWSVNGYSPSGMSFRLFQPGTDYRLKIKFSSTTYNMTDYFSLITDKLTIIEPKINSSYGAGEPIEITWISDKVYEYLNIQLYKVDDDAGFNRADFLNQFRIDSINQVPNTGYYRWNDTTNLQSGTYFIRITGSFFGAGALDESDDFTIVGNASIPGYSIILILGISSLMSSILIYRHLNTRKKLEK
ncbi:hypothetical protein LCGC14_1209850 [marine sediment metagenome]|uniref:Yeast cell wall synthesis Kre9/Knh1-like N-terminal domain-containing protein n=1 Tax=marine sediment metagenome TaxID=412755 RepID=A0A0F9PJ39_9ZZZZ